MSNHQRPNAKKGENGRRNSREFTKLLRRADEGDVNAANLLFSQVEAELRIIAKAARRHASPDVDCCTTMLVDDAFMKLVGNNKANWDGGDRRRFFGFAAIKIHDLFCDAVRKHTAKKRGGDHQRIDFDVDLLGDKTRYFGDAYVQIELREMLAKIEQVAPLEAYVFRFSVYLGMDFGAIADIMQVSKKEAEKAYAAAWGRLKKNLSRQLELDND